LLLGVACYVVPLLSAPTATVTLIPESRLIRTMTTLTVVTGTPDPKQVQGRLLSTLTLSQAKTVPTSGTGHQDARAARGLLTLYNALPAEQTVPAGTLLTGADGVQVVTEQDALLPAGSLSTNGRVTVWSHAVSTGPAGNIAAHDLYGPCCRVNVFVQNALYGGTGGEGLPDGNTARS
jgi:hypothetical protein